MDNYEDLFGPISDALGRNLSFTDAVSIEIMNEFGIENYLGFDAHFTVIVEQVSQENSE